MQPGERGHPLGQPGRNHVLENGVLLRARKGEDMLREPSVSSVACPLGSIGASIAVLGLDHTWGCINRQRCPL